MKFLDFKECEADLLMEADVCIIGSGPAGLSMATEFANSDLNVVILESGGLTREKEIDQLYEIESTGDPRHIPQDNIRCRIFGGTSHIWTGRCAPYDTIDFEHRDWIPHSGWPFNNEELTPFMVRAGKNLGLGPHCYDKDLWAKLDTPPPKKPLNTKLLRPFFWQFSASPSNAKISVDFGRDINLSKADNITVLLHANVTKINVNTDENQFESVNISTLEHKTGVIKGKQLVLACGGIENARLLLASNDKVPKGLGNHSDMVGRFLSDHILFVLGEFDPKNSRSVKDRFGHYWLDNNGKRHVYLHGLALSPEIQKNEGLLNCHAFIEEHNIPTNNPWQAISDLTSTLKLRNSISDIIKHTCNIILHLPEVINGLYRRKIKHRPQLTKAKTVQIQCILEQLPDINSRIRLSQTTKDALGMPISEIHWKMSDLERKTAIRMRELICQEFLRLGLPVPTLLPHLDKKENWKNYGSEKSHPMGTTRLSIDPSQGVVDSNLQVHGIKGLFIVGSSVFPTGGAANPTLLLVALAIRLADHIKALND